MPVAILWKLRRGLVFLVVNKSFLVGVLIYELIVGISEEEEGVDLNECFRYRGSEKAERISPIV